MTDTIKAGSKTFLSSQNVTIVKSVETKSTLNEIAQTMEGKIVYGDTDSIMIVCNQKPKSSESERYDHLVSTSFGGKKYYTNLAK